MSFYTGIQSYIIVVKNIIKFKACVVIKRYFFDMSKDSLIVQ